MSTESRVLEIGWDRRQSAMVLNALSELPFKRVFETIGSINAQAHRNFESRSEPSGTCAFRLSDTELRLCLEALQDLPYRTVRETAAHLEDALTEFDNPGPVA